ncbi:MAG: gliding motility-associated C-terminal domain-containing protein, partial [Bacteroidales bacterium]|nr:gliding motility-associated C-terminal domain-containing protein [Bacteroidales bacterium]
PNAFNPKSSIVANQTFGVVGDVSSLAGYKLQIYDRWGKILFETDDPTQPWDGKFEGGEYAPLGVYVWHAVFTTFESGIEPSKNIVNRGTVTLLR